MREEVDATFHRQRSDEAQHQLLPLTIEAFVVMSLVLVAQMSYSFMTEISQSYDLHAVEAVLLMDFT